MWTVNINHMNSCKWGMLTIWMRDRGGHRPSSTPSLVLRLPYLLFEIIYNICYNIKKRLFFLPPLSTQIHPIYTIRFGACPKSSAFWLRSNQISQSFNIFSNHIRQNPFNQKPSHIEPFIGDSAPLSLYSVTLHRVKVLPHHIVQIAQRLSGK